MRVSVDRLKTLHAAMADLACEDPVYLPIFARLDAELEIASMSNPVMRARALAKQMAA